MHTIVYLILLLSLFATQLTLSPAVQVDIPGRCSDVCMTDVEAAFFSCAEQIDSGCALQLCDDPEDSVKCGLKAGVPDILFTGESVTFSDLPVGRKVSTQIGIVGVLPKTDVYFLIDATGSMGPAIGAFRRTFDRLTDALEENGDFAFGVGIFRDESELDMGFSNLQGITTDLDLVKGSINTIRSRGGDDAEEANLVALYKIATGSFANWREDAGRVIVLYGDAVGHEPTCFEDVVLNRRSVSNALNRAGITVQAIGTEFSSLDDPTTQFGCGTNETAPAGQSTFIAKNTGGSLRTLTGNNVVGVLAAFSEALASTSTLVDVAESTCDRGVNVTFDPPLPGLLEVGANLSVSLRVKKRVCGRRSPFKCSISFKSGESVSEPLKLRFKDLAGCPP